jgi:hypothetical protein
MIRLFKKRLEGTFRDGQEPRFRKFIRTWLSWTDTEIRRTRRNETPGKTTCDHKQATEPVHDESGSIASKSPGNVDLLLALKRREQRNVRFEHPEESESETEAQE